MKKIKIGETSVSAIALGCMRLRDKSEKEAEMIVRAAIENGIDFFDHADIYGGGKCEELFGNILEKDKNLREKILIQSKCGICKGMYDFSKEHILEAVNGSLKRLKTDYLDYLLLHRPDALMEPEEIAEAFRILKKDGKVKNFGVSNQNPMQISLIRKFTDEKILINQLQFGIAHTTMIQSGINVNMQNDGAVNRDGGILDYCRLHDITLQPWSPFQYGFFEGVFLGNEKFPELNLKINELASKYEVSTSAIAIAWILRHPANMQPIIGTTDIGRIKDICKASEVYLTRKEWYEIYLAAGNKLP